MSLTGNRVKDCRNFGPRCPRQDAPDEFCSADSDPSSSSEAERDCKRWICPYLELGLVEIFRRGIIKDCVSTVRVKDINGKEFKALIIHSLPQGMEYEGKIEKTEVVVSEDGFLYLPLEDGSYHKNRAIDTELNQLIKDIFNELSE